MAIKVRKGDTLTSLAKANKTTVQAIAKANGIKDVNKIYAGTVLKNPITTQPVKPKTQQATTKKKTLPDKVTGGLNSNYGKRPGSGVVTDPPKTTKPPTTPKPTNPTVPPPVDGAVKPGTTTPPVTPATPPLTMKDIQDMFTTNQSELQKGYDERLASFERMMQEQADFQKKQYDDMMNRFRYTSVQVNPSSLNTNARDGIHLFDPGTGQGQTAPVVANQEQATTPGNGYQMNDTLFRYLNKMWNGGF